LTARRFHRAAGRLNHPGAQLRITDADGLRITGFLTNSGLTGPGHQLADLELRHRRHGPTSTLLGRVRVGTLAGAAGAGPDGQERLEFAEDGVES